MQGIKQRNTHTQKETLEQRSAMQGISVGELQ